MAQQENEQEKEEPGTLREAIGYKARRKIRARRRAQNPLWRGLGAMGMVGWSVAIPTLLGTLLGAWLDRVWETSPVPWTPVLLFAGLITGVALAWHWVEEERRDIGRDGREEND